MAYPTIKTVEDRKSQYRYKNMDTVKITSPIDEKLIKGLKTGTKVLISGVIYTARDAAHMRMVQALEKGEELPFDIYGQTIYYMGPSPARPGQVIGSAGPTTSSRMDSFTPQLLSKGLRAIIGKGNRSTEVIEALKKYNAVYFVTFGGAGALISKCIKKAEVIAYPDLAAEAIMKLEIEYLPAIVANDIYGNDLYVTGRAVYRKEEV
ncbi:MAG: Fe-S-containing hydro-lyase [Dehalococcoidales bacterium]|nr:Fe-S-containing hydro-lyase [Dehalococcoidales bacterium]